MENARQLFDSVDADGSGELDAEELQALYRRARGEKLGKKDLAAAMAEMDHDGGGTVCFKEFEVWWHAHGGDLETHRERAFTIGAGDLHLLLVAPDAATKERWVLGCREMLGLAQPKPEPEPEPAALPHVRMAQRQVAALPTLVVPAKKERDALFDSLDVNGNGGLSLAEIDKGVVAGLFSRALVVQNGGGSSGDAESFDHKPALMRAYHAADKSGDGFIERSEFPRLLQYMVFFNNLWHKFEGIDSDHDRRLDLAEFTAGCSVIGLALSPEQAELEFARCDADGGGLILFAEFCAWCAARHMDGMGLTEQMRSDAVGTAVTPRQAEKKRATTGDEAAVDAIRNALTTRFKSLSYGANGQDPRKLFSRLDRDNSGGLDKTEFRAAIRRTGHVSSQAAHLQPATPTTS